MAYFSAQPGLEDLIKLQSAQAAASVRKSTRLLVSEMLEAGAPTAEVVAACKESMASHAISEPEMVALVWEGLMDVADVRADGSHV